jgi:hypothetical protein
MVIIGLVGRISCGKEEISRYLEQKWQFVPQKINSFNLEKLIAFLQKKKASEANNNATAILDNESPAILDFESQLNSNSNNINNHNDLKIDKEKEIKLDPKKKYQKIEEKEIINIVFPFNNNESSKKTRNFLDNSGEKSHGLALFEEEKEICSSFNYFIIY